MQFGDGARPHFENIQHQFAGELSLTQDVLGRLNANGLELTLVMKAPTT